MSLDCPAGGVVIAAAVSAGSPTTTWSGVTEDSDVRVESNTACTSASLSFVSAQTALAVTADFSTPNESVGLAVSFPLGAGGSPSGSLKRVGYNGGFRNVYNGGLAG